MTNKYVAAISVEGVGALAGPLCAVALVFPAELTEPLFMAGGRRLHLPDFEQWPETHQKMSLVHLTKMALENAYTLRTPGEITHENEPRLTQEAGVLALARALERMVHRKPALRNALGSIVTVLDDGSFLNGCAVPLTRRTAEPTDWRIQTARLLALETRNELMMRADRLHPDYGFNKHLGYATRAHAMKLKKLGPCPEHRKA